MHARPLRRLSALALCALMLFTMNTAALAADAAQRRREAFLEQLSDLPHYRAELDERYLCYLDSEDYTAEQVLRLVNVNADRSAYGEHEETDVSKGVLMLVNKQNFLGRYKPKDLVSLGACGSWGSMAREARDAFVSLVQGASAEGYRIWGVSPYRSYDLQEYLYESYVSAHGQDEADTYSARPGWSEHQTGLAVDVAVRGESYGDFEGTSECEWMKAHAHEYGFILRYGEGVEYLTGYMYEPWHYRYVGVEAATYIYENDLTFEEYYYYYVVGDESPESPAAAE
ncbi:MAG: D-alanyl-D-alanine carboxypeptidase family protein [Ruminococcaceae bacterium]|nr:D-alanyl-D-alanine carboxypeptidase family protein [Oscillospiraceae bacterium]